MNKQEVIEKLQGIFRDVFEDETLELTENLSADDIENWSSLTFMLLTSEIEDAFSIKFSLQDLNRIKDVEDITAIVLEKTGTL